ncbi:hypothetical protein OQA88_5913 [Cercophora sp. LCS_1]
MKLLITLLSLLCLVLSKPLTPGKWAPLPSLPSPRQEHTTLHLPPSSIAIIGGIVPDNTSFLTTDLFQSYSISNRTWTTLARIPIPLNHPNAAVVNNKAYLLGGLRVAETGAWVATSQSWVYHPDTNKWEEIASVPGEARGSAAVGVHDGKVILAGGMKILEPWQGGRQESVDFVDIFDTRTGTWSSGPKLPGRRDHAGAGVVDGKMYVVGGREDGQAGVRGDVFELDLGKMESWVSRKGMVTPRGGISATVVGRRVFTFGGEGNPAEGSDGVFNETEVYDTGRDTWAKLGPMQVPRHGTSAVGVGGRVYIPGGGVRIGGAPVDYFDVFEPGC